MAEIKSRNWLDKKVKVYDDFGKKLDNSDYYKSLFVLN